MPWQIPVEVGRQLCSDSLPHTPSAASFAAPSFVFPELTVRSFGFVVDPACVTMCYTPSHMCKYVRRSSAFGAKLYKPLSEFVSEKLVSCVTKNLVTRRGICSILDTQFQHQHHIKDHGAQMLMWILPMNTCVSEDTLHERH